MRQRDRSQDRRPPPTELALEGRKERAHAEVTKPGVDGVGDTAGDDEPPFTVHEKVSPKLSIRSLCTVAENALPRKQMASMLSLRRRET